MPAKFRRGIIAVSSLLLVCSYLCFFGKDIRSHVLRTAPLPTFIIRLLYPEYAIETALISSESRLVVVASHDEDLQWLSSLQMPHIVYVDETGNNTGVRIPSSCGNEGAQVGASASLQGRGTDDG